MDRSKRDKAAESQRAMGAGRIFEPRPERQTEREAERETERETEREREGEREREREI